MPTSYLKAEQLPAWNTYAVLKMDHAANGRDGADGVLDRGELIGLAEQLEQEVERLGRRRHLDAADRDRLDEATSLLGDAYHLLDDLEAAGARGLVYLPNELLARFCPEVGSTELIDLEGVDVGAIAAQIPENLRRRASELLMMDDKHRFGRLTPELIIRAQARYQALDGRVGLHTVRSRETALRELAELAELLGYRELAEVPLSAR